VGGGAQKRDANANHGGQEKSRRRIWTFAVTSTRRVTGEQRLARWGRARLRDLWVDNQLKFRRLLDRQIGRFSASKHFIHKKAERRAISTMLGPYEIRPSSSTYSRLVHRRKTLPGREHLGVLPGILADGVASVAKDSEARDSWHSFFKYFYALAAELRPVQRRP
jgi:hypothetical protein